MKKIIGHQIVSEDGKHNIPECFYSFELFITKELADKWLEFERLNPEHPGKWIAVPVYEGDIEEPAFLEYI